MDTPSFVRLDLRAPLVYTKRDAPMPLWFCRDNGEGADAQAVEQVFCYEIDPMQGVSIEPERENFLGDFIFSGYAPHKDSELMFSGDNGAETIQIPAGIYLFTQIKSGDTPGKDACIDLAIEQQKDGLWEKNKLRNLLFIRFLFEDGALTTQIFRPAAA